MKYNIGDKVKIIDHWIKGMNDVGRMDKWFGKIMTVREFRYDYHDKLYYKMHEDNHEYNGDGWGWYDSMIAYKVSYSKEYR